ncbi:hypothetical protein HK18_02675 [Commensalibacter intestini]|uniref:DNA repair ATPase n=1 Tax=Commensalibacter intestini TaxID=479936 RepID=A0A251ZXT6_9PROT|nr:hypothetical protein [Commensalibacter intestini]OUI79477.1 hypothetical protein HK18_02675 [Commensalibacter intestini]
MKNQSNPAILRPGTTIGSIDAENDDNFLFECFVKKYDLDELLDQNSPYSIILGRTGSGKTAIVKYILSCKEKSQEIDLADTFMNYIANSNIIKFLNDIGLDLSLLFQTLWKHILCVEYIKIKWNITQQQENNNFLTRILNKFSKEKGKLERIQNYLDMWGGDFWLETDEIVKNITQEYENKFEAELGVDIAKKVKISGKYDNKLKEEKKVDIKNRVQKIISSDQLKCLQNLIDLLAKESNDQRCIYLLIDKLDSNWVDIQIRFKLIKALIDVLNKFRSIEDFKILVAIREDVFEKTILETKDIDTQREKLESICFQLRWEEHELKEIVNKRIALLYKRKYSKDFISYDNIFIDKVGQKKSFDYLISKTFMRPRDIISFVNECLSISNGKTLISEKSIRIAETLYIKKRIQAIKEEWFSIYPELEEIIQLVQSFERNRLEIKDFIDKFDDAIITLTSLSYESYLINETKNYLNNISPLAPLLFTKHIIVCLFRVGLINVKNNNNYLHSNSNQGIISISEINENTSITLHPILQQRQK